MNQILTFDSVKKKYADFELNVSFGIEKGYIMGLIGANGSGKTTTIKLIMNLIRKNSGEIKIFDKDYKSREKEIKQKIGFVYDDPVFYENISIKNMTKLYRPFYKLWDEKIYQKYLKEFGLDERKKIKALSKGTKMKYQIALALSHHAELIVMDEPTAGLDPVFRRRILEILQELVEQEETTIIFSSHITSDLDRIADFITFLKDGEVVFSGEKDRILENYFLIKGSAESLSPDLEKELIGCKKTSVGFTALASAGDWPSEFVIDRPSLEDIMYFYNINNEVNSHAAFN